MKITDVKVRFAGRMNMSAATFSSGIRGSRVASVGRRAKLLLIGLTNGNTPAAHLKMTGRFLRVAKGAAPTKYAPVVFVLDGASRAASGKDLACEDTRKFGYLKLEPTEDIEDAIIKPLRYCPEPLAPGFRVAEFAACIRRHPSKRIKPLLMDPDVRRRHRQHLR